MSDYWMLAAYAATAILFLYAGDRVGAYAACTVLHRCRVPVRPLPSWLSMSIGLMLPGIVLAGLLAGTVAYVRNGLAVVADNLELVLLGAFFLTGIIGGLFAESRNR